MQRRARFAQRAAAPTATRPCCTRCCGRTRALVASSLRVGGAPRTAEHSRAAAVECGSNGTRVPGHCVTVLVYEAPPDGQKPGGGRDDFRMWLKRLFDWPTGPPRDRRIGRTETVSRCRLELSQRPSPAPQRPSGLRRELRPAKTRSATPGFDFTMSGGGPARS